MNLWPQRPFIRKKVLDHRKAHGLSFDDFANLLGVKPSHLHGLLYDKRTRMTLEIAQKLSSFLFGEDGLLAAIPGVVGGAVNAAIWTLYLKRSRRVANTYLAGYS